MTAGVGVTIGFAPRADPLEAVAVAGAGAVARRLAERMIALADGALARLRGVAGADLVVALGEAGDLPWVDGVQYLGVDLAAPRLLVPTAVRPTVALELFQLAVLRRAGALRAPLAVMTAPRRIASVSGALPVERAHLRAWLERR